MIEVDDEARKRVEILYTNHRGEVNWRVIVPQQMKFISSKWHLKPQWVLEAYDCDKQANRTFAMNGIHQWRDYQFNNLLSPEIENSVMEIPDISQPRITREQKKDAERKLDILDCPTNGLKCSVCNKPQYDTPGGATCVDGHGGVAGYCDEPEDYKPSPEHYKGL